MNTRFRVRGILYIIFLISGGARATDWMTRDFSDFRKIRNVHLDHCGYVDKRLNWHERVCVCTARVGEVDSGRNDHLIVKKGVEPVRVFFMRESRFHRTILGNEVITENLFEISPQQLATQKTHVESKGDSYLRTLRALPDPVKIEWWGGGNNDASVRGDIGDLDLSAVLTPVRG